MIGAAVLISALAPALGDGVRGLIAKFTGGAGGQPQNVDERIKLMEAETDRLKTLADLDKPTGNPSQWIVDVRAVFRYAFVTMVWGTTALAIFSNIPNEIVGVLLDVSGACGSFSIGERMYLKIKG